MGLRIATNVQALAALRYLNRNHELQNRSLERLSSGSRINRAGDDAAGLAISEKLRSNIRSMSQASRNANDGISLIQVAEGAMNEVSNILVRIRELSMQGASDTIGDSERGFVDKEVQQLKEEIERIATGTDFNGRMLLNGSSQPLEIQVGIHNHPMQDRLRFNTQELASTTEALGISELASASREEAQNNLGMVDTAINKLNANRANLGALQNRLLSTINNIGIYKENIEAAKSRIKDTDMAEETTELTKQNILTQASVAVLGQANANPQQALKLLG